MHWFSAYFLYLYVAKAFIQKLEAKMQQFDDILIKRKNTLASMQTKLQVMHYTDHNEEFSYSTALLQVRSVLWDWFG